MTECNHVIGLEPLSEGGSFIRMSDEAAYYDEDQPYFFDFCPHCGSQLRGPPTIEESRHRHKAEIDTPRGVYD